MSQTSCFFGRIDISIASSYEYTRLRKKVLMKSQLILLSVYSIPKSVPKLELQVSVLVVLLMNTAKEVTTFIIDCIHFWSDSRVLTGWSFSLKKLKIFVANRLSEIHCCSDPSACPRVPAAPNPAEQGTRRLELQNISLIWLDDQPFLKEQKIISDYFLKQKLIVLVTGQRSSQLQPFVDSSGFH